MPPRPRDSSKLSQFWQELKRRRAIHVIIVYATAAFVIIELVGNVYESLQLPDWTPTLVILLLVIGFPFALIFSWIYDVTLKG
jgi:tryptophan-rich sensory protein